jgi:hypothetical protein
MSTLQRRWYRLTVLTLDGDSVPLEVDMTWDDVERLLDELPSKGLRYQANDEEFSFYPPARIQRIDVREVGIDG